MINTPAPHDTAAARAPETPPDDAAPARVHKRLVSLPAWRQSGLIAALLLMVIVFTAMYPTFFSVLNLRNILLGASTTAIIAAGEAFVIATSGIDLSVGSIAALAGIVGASMLQAGMPVPIAIVGGIFAGAVAGMINGVIIVSAKITPFMVTLGTMSVFSGAALVISNGRPLYSLPPGFSTFFSSRLAGVPTPVVFMIVIAVVLTIALRNSTLGEYALSIGGNEEATRLAGINISAYKVAVYTLSGTTAGLAGIIIAGRLATADPTAGTDLLLPAIAAAVMGGASLLGGEASIVGAIVGAVVITALQTGLTLIGVTVFYQIVAVGAVIIVAVAVDQLTKRRAAAH